MKSRTRRLQQQLLQHRWHGSCG